MTIVPSYTGPQCPRCRVALTSDWIRSGAITCPFCGRAFEATAFSPPPRKQVATTEVVTVGPEGANACANHARNAATASCQRCGLFICGLCDMNVGSGSYCPSCFERVRTEGTLHAAARRYRDFATMARSFAIAGLLLITVFGLPLGAAAMYYGVKARRQRRQEGRSTAGVTITIIVGLLEVLGGTAFIVFILYAIGKAAT
jgi:ribosomal protein L37AE/L43A